MKKLIKINGMSCSHCVKHVKDALEEMDQVLDVNVNLEEKNAIIDCKEELEDKKIKEIIEEVGYDVLEISNL